MKKDNLEAPQIQTVEEAKKVISFILQSMLQAGGVSNEVDLVSGIVLNLDSGEISPSEAVKKVREIESSRQGDYASS